MRRKGARAIGTHVYIAPAPRVGAAAVGWGEGGRRVSPVVTKTKRRPHHRKAASRSKVRLKFRIGDSSAHVCQWREKGWRRSMVNTCRFHLPHVIRVVRQSRLPTVEHLIANSARSHPRLCSVNAHSTSSDRASPAEERRRRPRGLLRTPSEVPVVRARHARSPVGGDRRRGARSRRVLTCS